MENGDEVELKRDYSKRHIKLFENLAKTRTTDWGIDGYALSFNYISDVFHVVKNKGTEDFKKDAIQRFTLTDYKVSSKTNRVGMLLDGQKIKAYYDDMPAHQSVKKEQYKLKEMVHLSFY